jgi:hypothetical protein
MVGSHIDLFNYGSDWYHQSIESVFNVRDIDRYGTIFFSGLRGYLETPSVSPGHRLRVI